MMLITIKNVNQFIIALFDAMNELDINSIQINDTIESNACDDGCYEESLVKIQYYKLVAINNTCSTTAACQLD